MICTRQYPQNRITTKPRNRSRCIRIAPQPHNRKTAQPFPMHQHRSQPHNRKKMSQGIYTILLLIGSNVFMTLAWYGHLKLEEMKITTAWPLIAIIAFSWAIAFFEYCLMVPANKIGFEGNGGPFSLMQLKVIQEVISLVVFTVIAGVLFQGQQLHWNHAVAFLCLVAAVFFAFLDK